MAESVELVDAIHDSKRLLAYAAAAGIQVSIDVTRTIIAATALLGQRADDPDTFELQAKFWDAYYSLVKNVHPVSASSLKASTRKTKDASMLAWVSAKVFGLAAEEISAPASAVKLFRRWALVTLIALLITQVYWVIGNTVVGPIDPMVLKVQQIADEISKKAAAAEEKQRLEAKREEALAEMKIRLEVLRNWNVLWRDIVWQTSEKSRGNEAGKSQGGESQEEESDFESLRSEMLYATFTLSALQLYLLPLLYGLLGACLFVLRNLANDLKSLTFTDDLVIQYRLRLYMGSLAGLVFVWFLPAADKTGPLSSLTSFAVAFLAGYSVELLFAFLDKIIAAFTAK